jgi:hypothetical protein
VTIQKKVAHKLYTINLQITEFSVNFFCAVVMRQLLWHGCGACSLNDAIQANSLNLRISFGVIGTGYVSNRLLKSEIDRVDFYCFHIEIWGSYCRNVKWRACLQNILQTVPYFLCILFSDWRISDVGIPFWCALYFRQFLEWYQLLTYGGEMFFLTCTTNTRGLYSVVLLVVWHYICCI